MIICLTGTLVKLKLENKMAYDCSMIFMVMKVIKLEVFLVMEISTGLKLNSSKFECQEVKYRIIQMLTTS